MAFRVCCSCGNAIANGYWLRHSRITSTTLNDIGDEEAAWTAVNDVHYRVTDSDTPWTAGTIKLCYGVRYETFMPSADNDLWPMFDSNVSELVYFPVTKPRAYNDRIGGSNNNAGSIFFTPPSTFTRSSLRETCHPENHVSEQAITHLVLPFSEIGLFNSTNQAAVIRPRYYRILNNGTPITGILSAIEDNAFTIRPAADVVATNTTGTPNNTTKYANLTSDTSDASFVYTTDNTVGTYRTRLETVTAPGYRSDHVLTYRIGASKNGVVVGSGDTGNAVDVTVSLKRSATVLVQETRTVPADWTTYTLPVPLSALASLSASAYGQLIVEIVTTSSGGSGGSQRGCALAFAKLTFSDSWAPSNWNYNFIGNTAVASAGASTGYIANSIVSTWKLPVTADKWNFKRNILFGMDVWYEIYKLSSSNTVKLGTGFGSVSTTAPTEGYSDGAFGVGAYFNSGFDPTKHTYKLTFNGGYLRPDEALGDEYVFPSDQKPATSVTSGENSISSVLSTHATGTWHYYIRFCRVVFVWACETPVIELHIDENRGTSRDVITYVPENTTGEVKYLKKSRSSGSPFDFGYQQNGLGNWEAPVGSTFVRCYAPVVNTTGTFTDQSDSLYPTSITVNRIQAIAKRVWHAVRDTSSLYTQWASAWIVPVGVSEITVECWGGGGGASNVYTGGGGAYARKTFSVTPGQSIPLEVGGAGLSDASAPYNTRTDGGATWFMSTTDCFADGGKAGNNSTTSYGIGGQASSSYGDVVFSGRNAAAGIWASSGGYNTNGVSRTSFNGAPSLGTKVDIFGAGAFSSFNAQFGGMMIHYTLPITPPSVWVYTEPTEWKCPSNITEIDVECWGAGGGGGATDNYSGSAAGGGGGGAYSKKRITVVPDTIYTVHPGTSGVGGVEGSINGQDGGDSWFWSTATILAKGGLGSIGATLDDDEAGAVGGAAASGVGTVKYSGGNGADGLSNTYGGGGGSSAGTLENGNTATNQSGAIAAILGGSGGNGTTATNGSTPGGGGGGAGATGGGASDTPVQPGGSGGRGKIQITQVL